MEFIENIYIGNKEINVEKTKSMLNEGISIFNTYLICIEKNGNNIGEIIHSKEIFKPNNANKNYICIGFALGKKKSFELFSEIVQDYIKLGKDLNNFKTNFK